MRTTHEAEAHADSSRELMPELQLAARCSSLSHDYNALILMAFVRGTVSTPRYRFDPTCRTSSGIVGQSETQL